MSKEVARFADVAMFQAEPEPGSEEGNPIVPQVTIISMTADPLRVMACANALYKGRVIRYPALITEEEALAVLADVTRTKLQAPLEFIDLHFFIDGVPRDFTHQLVRQRTAVYVQESLRFAVKYRAEFEIAMPPSISRLKDDDPMRVLWDEANEYDGRIYNALINGGIPAEDARKRLPHGITTRVHYKTNLRNLIEQSGVRLCSQAQYDWKQVWWGILNEIESYGPPEDRWQQIAIAGLFKPVCYRTGKCEFLSVNDRACRIRERVMTHHGRGEGPEMWSDIDSREALLEGAARVRPGATSG